MFLEHHLKKKRLVVISSLQNKKSSLIGQKNGRQEWLSNVVRVSIFSDRFPLEGGYLKKQKYTTINLVYKIVGTQH